jgi:two-component sensor histidine kinase
MTIKGAGGALADAEPGEQALRTSDALVDSLLAASSDVIALMDGDGTVQRLNGSAAALLARETQAPPIARRFTELWPAEARDKICAAVQTARCGEVGRTTVAGPDGTATARLFDLVIMPVRGGEGGEARFVAVARDVSERMEASEDRERRDRDVSHRIRNIFALISGLTRLSAQDEPAARPFAEALCERFGALSRAVDHLWPSPRQVAAGESDSLHALLRALLAPYHRGDGSSPFTVGGEDVALPTNAVTSLALIVHELAAEAVRRDALAAGAGIVIHCRTADGALDLTWSEQATVSTSTGGAEPEGLGSGLTARSIRQLRGTISHHVTTDGREVRLRLPLATGA